MSFVKERARDLKADREMQEIWREIEIDWQI